MRKFSYFIFHLYEEKKQENVRENLVLTPRADFQLGREGNCQWDETSRLWRGWDTSQVTARSSDGCLQSLHQSGWALQSACCVPVTGLGRQGNASENGGATWGRVWRCHHCRILGSS